MMIAVGHEWQVPASAIRRPGQGCHHRRFHRRAPSHLPRPTHSAPLTAPPPPQPLIIHSHVLQYPIPGPAFSTQGRTPCMDTMARRRFCILAILCTERKAYPCAACDANSWPVPCVFCRARIHHVHAPGLYQCLHLYLWARVCIRTHGGSLPGGSCASHMSTCHAATYAMRPNACYVASNICGAPHACLQHRASH